MNVLERVISFIADQNIEAYFVGGLVRDELLGRAAKRDIDLAIDGDASELARGFADPANTAFEAQVVPKHLTVNAASWISSTWLSCAVLGPAAIGFICPPAGGSRQPKSYHQPNRPLGPKIYRQRCSFLQHPL